MCPLALPLVIGFLEQEMWNALTSVGSVSKRVIVLRVDRWIAADRLCAIDSRGNGQRHRFF